MDHQQILDKVSDHLWTQGERAFDDGGCKYRTDEGLKCAVGCLIPENMYSPEMEAKNLLMLLHEQKRLGYKLPDVVTNPDNKRLLQELQEVHDNWDEYYGPNHLNEEFGKVAFDFDLTYTPR